MEHPCVTFVFFIDKVHQVSLYKSMLKECGVKYELFVLASFVLGNEYINELKPNAYQNTEMLTEQEALTLFASQATTSNFVIIPKPFIAKANWAREHSFLFEKSIEQCMVVPYIDYLTELIPSHVIDGYNELVNSFSPNKENMLYGVHWFEISVFKLYGAFLGTNIFDSLIYYRKKVEGVFFPQETLMNIESVPKEIVLDEQFLIHKPLRVLSSVEEIAYHDLSNFFEKAELSAQRFYFAFTATIGFRCDSLNSEQVKKLNEYCILKSVKYEIKSINLSKEQRLGNNLFVFISES
jgi:hypothetical protein